MRWILCSLVKDFGTQQNETFEYYMYSWKLKFEFWGLRFTKKIYVVSHMKLNHNVWYFVFNYWWHLTPNIMCALQLSVKTWDLTLTLDFLIIIYSYILLSVHGEIKFDFCSQNLKFLLYLAILFLSNVSFTIAAII